MKRHYSFQWPPRPSNNTTGMRNSSIVIFIGVDNQTIDNFHLKNYESWTRFDPLSRITRALRYLEQRPTHLAFRLRTELTNRGLIDIVADMKSFLSDQPNDGKIFVGLHENDAWTNDCVNYCISMGAKICY